MSINLLDLVKTQFGNTIAEKAGAFLGESTSNTQGALDAVLPTLMGALVSKGSNNSGAGAIMDMISNSNNGLDGSMLNNISDLFGGGNNSTQTIEQGNGILSMLLGNKLGGIVDMISSFSGMKRNSSSSLLSMVAPIIMSFIGKKIKSEGLGLSGLMSLLAGQKSHVEAAMPAGLSGIGSLLGFGDDVKENVRETVQDTTEAASSGLGKLLPWLGLAALVLGLLYFMRGCGDTGVAAIDNTVDAVTETTDNAADAVATTTTDLVNDGLDAAKSALQGIQFAAGSVGEKFSTFLSSGESESAEAFRFANLTFDTGSAVITGETVSEVDNLAAVLKAYPNVKIEIQGHTDNTGDGVANKTLSLDRAKAVVTRLVEQGIDASRLNAKGFGDSSPTASNDTEEGRAQNRRIEVKITER